jgi:arylsulfatase A-like enzyme
MVGLARWPGKIKPRVSNATVSTLDYLPTILALAGVALPSDREYDGIDISHVLLDGSDDGHETLFHPNSGASGIMGQLDAVRWNNWKAIYQTGGAADCTGSKGNVTRHDPPLLFNLDTDPAEETALDTTADPYTTIVSHIAALLQAKMHSVNTTFRSVVDTDTNVQSEPCVHLPVSESYASTHSIHLPPCTSTHSMRTLTPLALPASLPLSSYSTPPEIV